MCFLIRSKIASSHVQKVNDLPGKCSCYNEQAHSDHGHFSNIDRLIQVLKGELFVKVDTSLSFKHILLQEILSSLAKWQGGLKGVLDFKKYPKSVSFPFVPCRTLPKSGDHHCRWTGLKREEKMKYFIPTIRLFSYFFNLDFSPSL